MIDKSPEDRSKAVSLALRILDRVATEPAYKKDHGNLAGSVFGSRNKRAQLVSGILLSPAVGHFGILKAFAAWRRVRLGKYGYRHRDYGNQAGHGEVRVAHGELYRIR